MTPLDCLATLVALLALFVCIWCSLAIAAESVAKEVDQVSRLNERLILREAHYTSQTYLDSLTDARINAYCEVKRRRPVATWIYRNLGAHLRTY